MNDLIKDLERGVSIAENRQQQAGDEFSRGFWTGVKETYIGIIKQIHEEQQSRKEQQEP